MEDCFEIECDMSVKPLVSKHDQPRNQRGVADIDTEAVFMDQLSHSVPRSRKSFETDPLHISPTPYSKQFTSKTLIDIWGPCLTSSGSDSKEIYSEHPSSQSAMQSNVTVDSFNSSWQFSLKKILLKRSSLKASIENGLAQLSNPESSSKNSEGTHVSEQKFMDRISLAKTENALSNNVTPTSQLPTIVSLISVKKTLMKRTKNVLPKISVIKDTHKQHIKAKGLQRQVRNQIVPKKDPKSKEAVSEIGFKEEYTSTPTISGQKSQKKVSNKNTAPGKVPKQQKSFISKNSSPKVESSRFQSLKSKDITANPVIPCSECDKTFVSYRSLARHFRCHKKTLLYACGECPKTFKRRSSLLSHANVHSKEGRYQCSVCPVKFSWRSTFRTHLLSHEQRLDHPFRCLVCAKKFWYQQTWDQHAAIGGCRKKYKLSKRATYQCDICQRSQTTRGNLKKHLAMHQGLKPFVCETCGARFTAQTSLNEHVTRHSGTRPFVCHVCGKAFTQSSGFRQHLAIHNRADKFVCEFCKKGFKLNRYLVKHVETMHINESKYNCHHCGKLFKLGDYLRRHVKAVHPEAENVANSINDRKPSTESNDFVHLDVDAKSPGEFCEHSEDDEKAEDLLEVTDNFVQSDVDETYRGGTSERKSKATAEEGIKNFVEQEPLENETYCERLEKVEPPSEKVVALMSVDSEFKNIRGKALERMHVDRNAELCGQEKVANFVGTGPGNEALQMCEVTFEDEGESLRVDCKHSGIPASLENKLVIAEANDIAWPVKRQPIKRSSVRPFPCPVCTKSFRKQATLDSHMGSHSEERPVECDVCQHRFNTKQEVRRHLQSHGANSADELRCQTCGKVHLRLVDRKRHVCGSFPTFPCTQCDAVLERRTLLYQHVSVQHKASLECNICGKISSTTSNLKKHMTVHTGDKPFVCEVCGARFTANQSLKAHAALHEGQRPFVCSVCAKSFAQKSSLTQHEMLHDQEPRYACDQCDKKFKVVSYLRRHIAVLHTAEKRFGCTVCEKRYGLRSALAVHELTHRERRRFQCEECDKTFFDKRYMEKHAKKEHGSD